MICMSRRRRRSSEPPARRTSLPSKIDLAGIGLDEAQQNAAQRALAGAGLADQAESFAGFDSEGDVVEGADRVRGFPKKRSFRAEGLDEMASLSKGMVARFDSRRCPGSAR